MQAKAGCDVSLSFFGSGLATVTGGQTAYIPGGDVYVQQKKKKNDDDDEGAGGGVPRKRPRYSAASPMKDG